jgi:hypothetical protein
MEEEMQYRKVLYLALINSVVLAYLHKVVGLELLWYKEFFWFDMVTHFLGGFIVGLCAFWTWGVFLERHAFDRPTVRGWMYRNGWRWAFAHAPVFVGVVFLSVALGWEWWEVSVLHMMEPNYLLDTGVDLLMGAIGAVCAFFISHFISFGILRRNKSEPAS